MKKILFIIVIFFIIYSLCYYIFPSELTIYQTNLSDFNFNLLYKKQPIVINDKIVDTDLLLDSWFKQNFINEIKINNNNWNINNYKYLFIYSLDDDNELFITNAKFYNKIPPSSDEKIVNIKLHNNQSIIIPFKWKYYTEKNNFIVFGINDYITYFLAFFFAFS
jgi:hypothetical protein